MTDFEKAGIMTEFQEKTPIFQCDIDFPRKYALHLRQRQGRRARDRTGPLRGQPHAAYENAAVADRSRETFSTNRRREPRDANREVGGLYWQHHASAIEQVHARG